MVRDTFDVVICNMYLGFTFNTTQLATLTIMKHLLFFLFLTSTVVYGQKRPLTGKYISKDDYVLVSDTTMEFKTRYGCCLPSVVYGYGKYKVQNDSVYVTTTKPSNEHCSSFTILNTLPTPSRVQLKIENNGKPVQFCDLSLKHKGSDQILNGYNADSGGLAVIDNLPADHSENIVLTIFTLGYDHLEIPLNEISGKSIVVHLLNYRVLRNEQVAFKLIGDSTSTKLVGPVIQQTKEEIQKAEKAQRKRNAQTLVRTRPWNWHFNNTNTHTDIPTTFERQ